MGHLLIQPALPLGGRRGRRTHSIWHMWTAAVPAPSCLGSACPASWLSTMRGALYYSILFLKPQSIFTLQYTPLLTPDCLPWIFHLPSLGVAAFYCHSTLSITPSLLPSAVSSTFSMQPSCSTTYSCCCMDMTVLPWGGITALG